VADRRRECDEVALRQQRSEIGVVRRVVLIPRQIVERPAEHLEQGLHERHVRRREVVVRVFHPLIMPFLHYHGRSTR
jgi:hypothetical protein